MKKYLSTNQALLILLISIISLGACSRKFSSTYYYFPEGIDHEALYHPATGKASIQGSRDLKMHIPHFFIPPNF